MNGLASAASNLYLLSQSNPGILATRALPAVFTYGEVEHLSGYSGVAFHTTPRAAPVRLNPETTDLVVVTNRLFVRTASRIRHNVHLMNPNRWIHRGDPLRLVNKHVLCTFPVTCALPNAA